MISIRLLFSAHPNTTADNMFSASGIELEAAEIMLLIVKLAKHVPL